MIWLGTKRGYLTDWITQCWVKCTGRRIDIQKNGWLEGPIAPTTGIAPDYFETLARAEHLVLKRPGGPIGIIPDFSILSGKRFQPAEIQPAVIQFYQETSAYELDVWAEWCGIFRPFGLLLAILFSRRLRQLNVPLSSLDTSRGMASEVLTLVESTTGVVRRTAWYRTLRGTGNVIYAGFYSACSIPNHADPCIKVTFPLPNGNATVLMKTERRPDGSFAIISSGNSYGDPGFYFTVYDDSGRVWARYVRSMRESIHVYPDGENDARADHVLTYFGATFLRLHYRMRHSPTLPA
jgi:hypothetical protein